LSNVVIDPTKKKYNLFFSFTATTQRQLLGLAVTRFLQGEVGQKNNIKEDNRDDRRFTGITKLFGGRLCYAVKLSEQVGGLGRKSAFLRITLLFL
jgi:hypothetical protein